jgi:uncharacterized repeat protein (TIGR01451 family)
MRTRNASTTFHLVNSLARSIFQKTNSNKQAKHSSTKYRRFAPLLVFAALIGVSFIASSNYLFSRTSSAAAPSESISTFDGDCTTPKTTWDLGGTACATATGAPDDRRIAWVAPDGTIAQLSSFFSGSGSDTYQIPTGSDPFAQVGTWAVTTIDINGVVSSEAEFVVRDPNNASVDLSISNHGPFQISSGSQISYRVEVVNKGPDAAQSVVITSSVPGNTTFVSESQNSGPTFTCTTPSTGSTGTISCTLATLPANSTAIFTLTFQVGSTLPDGTVISNTANISSATNELHAPNNSATASSTVTSSTPSCTISCPSVAPVSTSQCSAIVNFATPTASGNCGTDPEEGGSGIVCTPTSGSTFPIGNTVVTCIAPTGDSCSFTVTVNYTGSTGAVTIACPSNITVDTDLSGGSAQVNYAAPTTNGNCLTVACSPPSGSLFPTGTTTVTCTATDPSNATASCSFTVTVNGGTGGGCTINCPGDITQNASSGQCNAVVTYSAPTTSGTCGAVTCNPASGSTFPIGSTVVTCSSTDGANCDFTVNVIPASPPTITACATNKTITANAECLAVIPNLVGEVVATGCNVIISQSPTAGSIVEPGTVTVTITAENSAGETTCTATVLVRTPVAPTITPCPADFLKSNDADQCGAVVNYAVPTGSSNCSSVTVSCLPPSGSFFPIGETNVTCTATDVSGNSTTCTFKVTVNDSQLPTITCPANVTQGNDQDQCGAVVNYTSPTGADNCPGVNTVCSPATGTQFPVGTTTVNCTTTDASNNQASCSFTVTVNDTQPPTITCPSNIAVGTNPNSITATVNFQLTVSDNCPGATSSCTPPSGSQFPIGTTTVTCTATDATPNQANCSFTVTVSDTQPPTITCPASIVVPNGANLCGAAVSYTNPVVTDNQPGATFACSPAAGSIFPVGVTVVTCTATDVGGNHSTCSFSVTVNDTQLPVISCPANITAPNTPGQCFASVNPGVATAADNCPGVTVAGTRSDGLTLDAAYPVGTTTIIWTARDAAGNQVSCTQTIVVNDTQAPTITMVVGQQMELWPPNHQYQTVRVSDFVAGASDNCSGNLTNSVVIDSISSDEPDDASGGGDGNTTNDIVIAADCKTAQLRAERQGSGNGRVYTITFRVRDAAGNVKTATAQVKVPKSQGNNGGAVDDGPDHTVNSTCP